MPWKRGQLGRFKAENPRTPRFELLGVDKEKRLVRVWYNLKKRPTTIPVDTFKKDCVNWWEVSSTKGQVEVPDWVKKGSLFQIEDFRHPTCLQWLRPKMNLKWDKRDLFLHEDSQFLEQLHSILGGEDYHAGLTTTSVEEPTFRKQNLQIRSVYLNYTSCTIEGSGALLLVPLQVVAAAGVRRTTAWTRLVEDPFEEAD
jgi:hypothetical protein